MSSPVTVTRRVALFALALLAAGCTPAGPPSATVETAQLRLPAAPGVPGGGYFTARLSSRSDALVSVSSPAAQRIEMHDTIERDGVSSMVQLDRVPVADGEPIRFAPGGKHLMVFGLNPGLHPGATVPLTFTFAEAPPVTVQAELVGPGGMTGAGTPAPGHAH